MSFLYFLEGIRTPFLNQIMNLITQLGFETAFLVVALWIYWCVDKRRGFYILTIGFWGLEINQLLKMIFRVPRPWVLDPDFTIVDIARKDAGGYSFPSGHVQIATGVFGAMARTGKKAERISGIIIVLLVAFSRMYLGAHTPWDVGVSLVIGTILIFALYPFFFPASGNASDRKMAVLFGAMAVFSVGVSIYIGGLSTPLVDAENLADAMKTTSTVLGSLIAVIAGYYIEKKYIRFNPKASMKVQILKFVFGLVCVLILKAGLKMLLASTPLSSSICDMIRYNVLVIFALIIWPWVIMKITGEAVQ